jgi:hypothetical protein
MEVSTQSFMVKVAWFSMINTCSSH